MKKTLCAVAKHTLYGLLVVNIAACGGGGSTGGSADDSDPIAAEFPIVATQIPTDDLVPESEQRVIPTDEVVPFRSDSPYASVLKECALAQTVEALCTNQTLPYIGQDHANPTIDDILNRVLVSHEWMGVRFAQLLLQFPKESMALFKPVTSITIGSDVRPSGFYPWQGSIRLDPDYLWLTLSEKRTVSTEDDPRSGYGSDLQFLHFWRYMKDNRIAYSYSSLEDDEERSINDIALRAARLLYHELAHANDYVNPKFFPEINPESTPRDMLDTFASRRISQVLYDDMSLSVQRSWLFGLASVRFRDEAPSDELLAFTPATTGAVMGNEGKTTFYSYSTIREDMANLFEAAMMQKHFGVETYTAFVEKPVGYPDSYSCDELIVGWGESNRLAAALVAPRAKFVVDQVLGETAGTENFFANDLGNSGPLPEGEDWCDILYPDVASSTSRRILAKKQIEQLEIEYLKEQRHAAEHLRY